MLVGRAWPTVWPLRSRYARPVPRASGGDDGGTDADGSRRGQRQEQEKEVQRTARKRAQEEGRGATGPAHDLRDREAETERKRELVTHSGKNGGERGGAGVTQAGAALLGSAKEQTGAVMEKSRAIEHAGQQALEIADTLVRSGAVDIVVIDSVAALVPREEIEGEMGDAHVGLQARLMSQALRKLTGTISKTKTTVIFINQLRERIGVLYGNPETTSGGRALKFYASIRIDIRPIEPIKQG